jgi:hypothetical protein
MRVEETLAVLHEAGLARTAPLDKAEGRERRTHAISNSVQNRKETSEKEPTLRPEKSRWLNRAP